MDLPDKIRKLIEQMKENVKKATGRRNDNFDFQLLNELRKTHRELYISIESNRQRNQYEKDKLDKETIQSECLNYSKNQLTSSIHLFRTFSTENFDSIRSSLHLDQKDPLNDKNDILGQLETELTCRKEKRVKLEQICGEFHNLEEAFREKEQQYFEILPEQLRKIQDELAPVLDVFRLPQLALPQQYQYYNELPEQLLQIHQKLNSNLLQLEIIKNAKQENMYKLCEYELKVTLLDGITNDLVLDYFGITEQQFYENVYPVKFSIKYFTTLDKIVFQIDRQNSLTSEELFCGLLYGDPGEPLIINAQSDEEININTKYMWFKWTKDLVGLSLTAKDFHVALQQRIFNLTLLKLQLTKLQKTELPKYMPGLQFDQHYSLKYFGRSQIIEQKPFWYDLCVGSPLETHYSKQDTRLVPDERIQQYVRLNYLLENSAEHLHDSYQMVLAKDDNSQEVEIGLIIPLNYPKQSVRFTLLNNCDIPKKLWYQQLSKLDHNLVEGLQLSHQILRITEWLSGLSKQKSFQIRQQQ